MNEFGCLHYFVYFWDDLQVPSQNQLHISFQGFLAPSEDNQVSFSSFHGFRLFSAPAGETLTEVEIPQRLAFPQTFDDGRLAPFVRIVDRWVQAIDAGRSMTPSLREGVYSQLLMDLTHQSNDKFGWVDVPELDLFLQEGR